MACYALTVAVVRPPPVATVSKANVAATHQREKKKKKTTKGDVGQGESSTDGDYQCGCCNDIALQGTIMHGCEQKTRPSERHR